MPFYSIDIPFHEAIVVYRYGLPLLHIHRQFHPNCFHTMFFGSKDNYYDEAILISLNDCFVLHLLLYIHSNHIHFDEDIEEQEEHLDVMQKNKVFQSKDIHYHEPIEQQIVNKQLSDQIREEVLENKEENAIV